jgi:hypothetical protein
LQFYCCRALAWGYVARQIVPTWSPVMANLQADKKGNFSVFFRWRGKPFCRSLKTKDLWEAETRLAEIETLVYRLGAGLLTVPDDADVASFVVSGGPLSTSVT